MCFYAQSVPVIVKSAIIGYEGEFGRVKSGKTPRIDPQEQRVRVQEVLHRAKHAMEDCTEEMRVLCEELLKRNRTKSNDHLSTSPFAILIGSNFFRDLGFFKVVQC